MDFREKVINCLGKFPDKTNLSARLINSEDKGTHLLQLVNYKVEENESVNAYLLIPKTNLKKYPAIVASHQHAGEYFLGKSEPAGLSANKMYHYGLDLCLRGYVVICPDHLCFEDRRPPEYERMQNKSYDGMFYERFTFSRLILEGSTLQAKYISDLCKAIDYLETLDFVDKNNIGAIGHSLGGQETLWLSWYEPRIKAAVSSCGFSQLRSIVREGVLHNFAAYAFGFLNLGDTSDIVCDMAPKPFMMTNGTTDSLFPMDGVKEIAGQASAKYSLLGKSDNFKSVVFEGGHSFPDEVKNEAYDFLDKHLK